MTLLFALACGGAGAPAAAPAACPDDMLAVPGGSFRSGATAEEVGASLEWPETWHRPRPPAEREVGPFCMDRYEYPNVAGERPRVLVRHGEAADLCAARGRRLCTEDEWTRACVGEDARLYPYGTTWEPGRCLDDVEVGHPEALLPSGSRPGCVSPYGVADLQGSVSEWVQDAHADYPGMRVLRGGTMWTAIYGRGCMARHAHEAHGGPTHDDDGFRCCLSQPEPQP